ERVPAGSGGGRRGDRAARPRATGLDRLQVRVGVGDRDHDHVLADPAEIPSETVAARLAGAGDADGQPRPESGGGGVDLAPAAGQPAGEPELVYVQGQERVTRYHTARLGDIHRG